LIKGVSLYHHLNESLQMRIHEQNEVLKEQVKILKDGITEIKAYLNSSKFDIDTNVNKQDILNRIQEMMWSFNNTPEIPTPVANPKLVHSLDAFNA
jgi:hypothetical protein